MSNHRELLGSLGNQEYYFNRIYGSMASDLGGVLKRYKLNGNSGLWHKNLRIKKEVDAILKRYRGVIYGHISSNVKGAWEMSNKHNDVFVKDYIKDLRLTNEGLRLGKGAYFDRNNDALKAFISRGNKGFRLSDRVWDLTNQTQSQLEYFIADGLTQGRSAVELTGDLKRYLKKPEKRFRRNRSKVTGKLVLSDPAKNYHPGRGVYRSSYKNALRLSRNEINIAYRTADFERRKGLPFVTGFVVHLSNAHPEYDICDELVGEYPKNFKFTGWHPQCLCFTTSKKLSREDFIKHLKGEDIASSKQVVTIPNRASKFLSKNSTRIKGLKSKPYFIADNFKNTKDGFGLRKGVGLSEKLKTKSEELNTGSEFVPSSIGPYEKRLGITINRGVFSYLTRKTPLNPKGITPEIRGAYYHPLHNYVKIPFDARRKQSKWSSESVVYHEFGHAADSHRDLKNRKEVGALMTKFREKFSKDNDKLYKSLDLVTEQRIAKSLIKRDFDGTEKLGAFWDTLMSLNQEYGKGHKQAYWKIKGRKEAEFIAHAFENKFAKNNLFEELAPDLYREMIKLVDGFKIKQK